MSDALTPRQKEAEAALDWCRQRGVEVEWLNRERVLCRLRLSLAPVERTITVIAPSFLDAYAELRAELARIATS